MEIWNLVFMQYERDAKGALTPLPKPSIDTGMGLERTASILQGVDTNYEIDLFAPIFEAIWRAAKVNPEDRQDHANRTASQVIADHIRAATFMCFDGVVPSNEGRGYVLRKIVRRALRFGKKLGIEGAFFAGLVPAVHAAMGDAYPELQGELGRIQKVLGREEAQFSVTLNAGLKQLEACDVAAGTPAPTSSSYTTPSASPWIWWRTGAGSAAFPATWRGSNGSWASRRPRAAPP
jgi:alanyl-tRNA synthetase